MRHLRTYALIRWLACAAACVVFSCTNDFDQLGLSATSGATGGSSGTGGAPAGAGGLSSVSSGGGGITTSSTAASGGSGGAVGSGGMTTGQGGSCALTLCGPDCVDLQTDPAHCGDCAVVCATGAHATPACVAGMCGVTCDPGFADCNVKASDGCEVDLSKNGNCGACGNACPAGHACFASNPNGTASFCGCSSDGDCTNNGTCGPDHVCTCAGNTCDPGEVCTKISGDVFCTCGGSPACGGGQTCCPMGCADLMGDAQNCGACKNVCPNGQSCNSGTCG